MSKTEAIYCKNGNVITTCVKSEDEKIYHRRSGEFMSSHQLRDFRKCPALFIRKRSGLIPHEDRPAYQVGRALHCLAFEGRIEFDRRYLTGGPINPKTNRPFGSDTKAFREWAAEQDREVVSDDQSALIETMAAAIAQHDIASKMLSGGVGEGVIRHEYCDIPCQIRIDCLHPEHGLIDLKTCEDLDWFENDAKRYGYLHQLAFYRDILAKAAEINADNIPCRFVAVEKNGPYRCGVWLATSSVLNDCAKQNQQALAEYRECENGGIWPTWYEIERSFYAI